MFIASLVGTLIVVGIVNLFVWTPRHYGAASLVSLLLVAASVLVCGAAVFLPPASITALLLLICSLTCYGLDVPVARFRVWSLVMGLLGMIAGIGFSDPYVRHLQELRAQYPVRSLASRLAYESRPADSGSGTSPARQALKAPPPKGAPAWEALEMDERNRSLNLRGREWALEKIHATALEQFANAPGFGIARMPSVDGRLLAPRPRPAPLTAPSDESSPPPAAGPLLTVHPPRDERDSAAPLNERLWRIHGDGVRDFLDPDQFGWVVDRNHVAGFESHRFSNQFSEQLAWDHTPDIPAFELTQLELVSLLKFETPRVYVSGQNLPRLDAQHDATTRALNRFETAGLALLVKGEAIVYHEGERRLTALGSLRAGSECLKCHEVERGALLGAFSYQFNRRVFTPRAAGPITPFVRRGT